MHTIIRYAVAALSAFLLWPGTGVAVAAAEVEIVNLRNRVAEDVLPQLQPFVEGGGMLSGMNDKLFMKVSTRNRAQLMELLAAIDVPLRRLLVTLAREDGLDGGVTGGAATGAISLGSSKPGAGGTAQVYSTRQLHHGTGRHQVQTIDGARATLTTGETILVPLRQSRVMPGGQLVSEGVVMREIQSGFVVLPRLNGERVTVEIEPGQQEWTDGRGGSAGIRLSTTLNGRLGEWIDLGGSSAQQTDQSGAAGQYAVRSGQGSRRFLLRVDELR